MKAKQVKYWNGGYSTLMISLDSLTVEGGGGATNTYNYWPVKRAVVLALDQLN